MYAWLNILLIRIALLTIHSVCVHFLYISTFTSFDIIIIIPALYDIIYEHLRAMTLNWN